MKIGDKLSKARKSKNWTQKELARRAGISLTALQQYEYHKRQPTLEQIQKLSNALEISVALLLGTSNHNLKYCAFTSEDSLRDWLESFGYKIHADTAEGYLWIRDMSNGIDYEITESQLKYLSETISAYTKFQIHDLLKNCK